MHSLSTDLKKTEVLPLFLLSFFFFFWNSLSFNPVRFGPSQRRGTIVSLIDRGLETVVIHVRRILFLFISILMGKKVNKEMGIMRALIAFSQILQLTQKIN